MTELDIGFVGEVTKVDPRILKVGACAAIAPSLGGVSLCLLSHSFLHDLVCFEGLWRGFSHDGHLAVWFPS